MIHQLQLKKIFCWVQEGTKVGKTLQLPHGLAMGEDGVMLGMTKMRSPSTIMPALAHLHTLYDDHFGKGNWELVFVPKNEVEEVGLNLDFEVAMSKNTLLAKQAGL